MRVTQQEKTYQDAKWDPLENVRTNAGRSYKEDNYIFLITPGIEGIPTFKMHTYFLVLRQRGLNGYIRRKVQNLIPLGQVARFHIM
jgi:hypothetical protein